MTDLECGSSTYSPASIAQIPVPVPMSRIRWGLLPTGDRCSLFLSIRRQTWWMRSSLFVRSAIVLLRDEVQKTCRSCSVWNLEEICQQKAHHTKQILQLSPRHLVVHISYNSGFSLIQVLITRVENSEVLTHLDRRGTCVRSQTDV